MQSWQSMKKAPLSGSFFVQAVMFTQANTTSLAFSMALGSGGDPAWGAKKVGEKPSFSPRGPVAGQPYFFAFLHTTRPAREHNMPAQALGPK